MVPRIMERCILESHLTVCVGENRPVWAVTVVQWHSELRRCERLSGHFHKWRILNWVLRQSVGVLEGP